MTADHSEGTGSPGHFPDPEHDLSPRSDTLQSVILAGGCFWCVEAVFRNIDGVVAITSGYCGGDASSANYEAVCSGTTGHAEAVKIDFDPGRVPYGQLLKVFFSVAHDPTQRNRQGADRGTQYRSAIFYADSEQQAVVLAYIHQIDAAKVLSAPIVTEVVPLGVFYPAESYHHDYAAKNPQNPYITHVANPKVQKLRTYFGAMLNTGDAKETKS